MDIASEVQTTAYARLKLRLWHFMQNVSPAYLAYSYITDLDIKGSLYCLCWGFTAQSIQWGHVECGQFT